MSTVRWRHVLLNHCQDVVMCSHSLSNITGIPGSTSGLRSAVNGKKMLIDCCTQIDLISNVLSFKNCGIVQILVALNEFQQFLYLLIQHDLVLKNVLLLFQERLLPLLPVSCL